jgi:hypothetical protein
VFRAVGVIQYRDAPAAVFVFADPAIVESVERGLAAMAAVPS